MIHGRASASRNMTASVSAVASSVPSPCLAAASRNIRDFLAHLLLRPLLSSAPLRRLESRPVTAPATLAVSASLEPGETSGRACVSAGV